MLPTNFYFFASIYIFYFVLFFDKFHGVYSFLSSCVEIFHARVSARSLIFSFHLLSLFFPHVPSARYFLLGETVSLEWKLGATLFTDETLVLSNYCLPALEGLCVLWIYITHSFRRAFQVYSYLRPFPVELLYQLLISVPVFVSGTPSPSSFRTAVPKVWCAHPCGCVS